MRRRYLCIFVFVMLFAAEAMAQNISTPGPDDTVLDTAVSNGYVPYYRGRRSGSGGKTVNLKLDELKDSDILKFRVVGGKLSSLTVHGRTSRGSWHVLHRGGANPVTVGDVLKGRRSQFTHLIIQVNGRNNRYMSIACRLEVIKAAEAEQTGMASKAETQDKPAPADNSTKDDAPVTGKVLATATNNGTGRWNTGGQTANLLLNNLKDSDTINFRVVEGQLAKLTIHGRTSRGVWTVLYRGNSKAFKVGDLLKGQRNKYTHFIVQVNGEHNRYDKRTCKLEIVKAEPPPPQAPAPAPAPATDKSNRPVAIVPPMGVVAASNATTPSIRVKASTAFDKGGNNDSNVQSYVDLKIYFDKTTGAVTADDGSGRKPVIFKDADGNVISTPSQDTLQSGSVTHQAIKTQDAWVLARTSHF